MFKYKHAILGGTFDRLHAGHKHFIEAAGKVSERVTIGLVADKFLGDRLHKDIIEPYGVRKKELRQYLRSKNYDDKTIIYPLSDIFGPSLNDPDIDMVLAIEESIENAKVINRERVKRGLSELEIVVAPIIKADDGGLISSKRIRDGEIDRNGYSYLKMFGHNLVLPQNLKQKLRQKFGKVLKNDPDYKNLNNNFIIAVGDIVTVNMVKNGRKPDISIFDYKTNREEIADKNILKLLPKPDTKTLNMPGTINKNAVIELNFKIRNSLKNKNNYAIAIKGEEDLLALPAILLSPLAAIVIYGLHDVGAIVVNVEEKTKSGIKEIIGKFNKI